MDIISNKKYEKFFIEPTEKLVAVLGSNYIENYLMRDITAKGFAIVSDKRVYYKGKHYEKGKNNILKFTNTINDQVVDLKDITGTEYEMTKNSWMDILSNIFLFVFVISLVLAVGELGIIPIIVFLLSFINFIGFWVAYKMTEKNTFWILYSNGAIGVNSAWYSKTEIEQFQKQLRLAKDYFDENKTQTMIIKTEKQTTSKTVSSIADELTKLGKLLKDGLISKEEYDRLKTDLLEL